MSGSNSNFDSHLRQRGARNLADGADTLKSSSVEPVSRLPFAIEAAFAADRFPGEAGARRHGTLDVLEPIPTAGLTIADLDALRERTRLPMWRGLGAMEEKDAGQAPDTVVTSDAQSVLPHRDEARAT